MGLPYTPTSIAYHFSTHCHLPGPSGLVFLDETLKAGHEVTIFARNPSKLPADASSNPKVHIVKGEFSDLDKAKEALNHGAEVLVSFAGPSLPNKGTVTSLPFPHSTPSRH